MNAEATNMGHVSSFEQLEAEDRQRVVLEHAGPSLMTFLPVSGFIGFMEWVTRPSHRTAVLIVGALYIVIATTCVAILRWRPQWAVRTAVGGVSALCATMLSYSPLVQGSGELCVLAMTVLLGGFAVAFPLGLRNQLLASIVPLLGYASVLHLGTTTAYPLWYSASALLAFLFVLAISARGADQSRSRILQDGFRQAALAAENGRLRDEAQAADRAKTDLMSILSHELRSPLFAIRMLSESLAEGTVAERQEWAAAAQRVCNQSKYASDLVQTMLEFGRMESGEIRASVEEFDIAAVLRRVRDEIPATNQGSGVNVNWAIPMLALPMRSDPGKVEAIVRNLLHNALRHTTAGSVTVGVSADQDRGLVQFTVTDTGEGISAEALPHIFDRFSRATSTGSGFGLGLYIVRRFTDLLGGEISVQSTPGVGTCFTVRLPREVTTSHAATSRAA